MWLHSDILSLSIPLRLSIPPSCSPRASRPFPRGPGLYFSLLKLLPVLLVYFMWVRICWWADHDARKLHLVLINTWNPVLFGCGVLGLFASVWVFPWFLLSFPILLALFIGPTFAYINLRNARVPEEERVLTEHHLRQLAARYLKIGKVKATQAEEKKIPIRFINKSLREQDADEGRDRRVEESKGYKAALEMVYEAIQARATDIHMEPTREEMSVRFRIDGILQATPPFSRQMGDSVLNIFKVIADLDITEKRKPQDGSFSAKVEGRDVDFRVATAGSVAGEKMVMRILDKERAIANLTRLGMRDKLRDTIHEIVGQPHGLFIVCGPTGAGKSTTLYACLSEIDRYQRQSHHGGEPRRVHTTLTTSRRSRSTTKRRQDFRYGELRSILRQDPDVIYIGEIRDQETAEIACQAAQTGHMVFTTLHANDTVTAIGRLIDLGVQPFMIASALSAVLGQRLVRILCPACKVRYKPNPDMLRKANLPADKIKFFFRPPEEPAEEDGEAAKCPQCGSTGCLAAPASSSYLSSPTASAI